MFDDSTLSELNLLKSLDYSVLQQCMHCGMCLPTCPTYDETRFERSSPRGRIRLMREVADGRLDVTPTFAEEMSYCLGCLACQTACPAGVNYATLLEHARGEARLDSVGHYRSVRNGREDCHAREGVQTRGGVDDAGCP